MKINLELEVGMETGVVVAALEALTMNLQEANQVIPKNPMADIYIDIANRLRSEIDDKCMGGV